VSARRTEILRIAADLFAGRGFANVTVDDIGAAAGVSGPALYHHFAGKEALLGEMLIDISQYLLNGGRDVVASGGDVLGGLIRFHAEFAVERRSLITVHFRDLVHASAADQAKVRSLQARYVSLWTDELQRLSPTVERNAAHAAVHATFGLINSTPFSSRLPRAAMLPLLTTMAEGAVRAAIGTDAGSVAVSPTA
jgi:AcrR family transcriptional regulator